MTLNAFILEQYPILMHTKKTKSEKSILYSILLILLFDLMPQITYFREPLFFSPFSTPSIAKFISAEDLQLSIIPRQRNFIKCGMPRIITPERIT